MNENIADRTGRTIGAIILIAVGVLALLGNFLQFDVWHFLWPFIIIGFGLAFFVGMLLLGKSGGGLAIPGSIFTMVGLILLAMNTFGHWQAWAYAWALVAPTGVGIGMMIFSRWSDQPPLWQAGRVLITIGLILFFVFGAFFELATGGFGFANAGRYFLPVLLIGLGLLLLLSRTMGRFSASPSARAPDATPPSER